MKQYCLSGKLEMAVPNKKLSEKGEANDELDDLVWEWFSKARSKSLSASSKMIQQQAIPYIAELGYDDFAASNGWYGFQQRHGVRQAVISGKAADVPQEDVDDWHCYLSNICKGYELKDMFNVDETGLFFCALPNSINSGKRRSL